MSDNNNPNPNPYAAPTVTTLSAAPEAGSDAIIPDGRSVGVGQGVSWIGQGWQLFTASPMIWIVNMIIMFVIAIVLSLIPFLGGLVLNVLAAVLVGGLMLGAHAQHNGQPLEVGHLFEGFKTNTSNLLIVGLIYMAGGLIIGILMVVLMMVVLGVSGGFGAFFGGDQAALGSIMAGAGIGMVLIGLLALALTLPLIMAFWFAPALVAINGMAPVAAMKASFFGCLKNILPFLIWGIIFLVLIILGAIPILLGWLVVFPLMFASSYAAYRDIYIGD
jgi:uncharacterized membrane protein